MAESYKTQGKLVPSQDIELSLFAQFDSKGRQITSTYERKMDFQKLLKLVDGYDIVDKCSQLAHVKPNALTWGEISAISEVGLAKELFRIGDEKDIPLATGENITMVVLGFEHDNLTSGRKAGITFGMKDCLETEYQMNAESTNIGGWKSSQMRTSTMEALYGILPTEVQVVIKPIDKRTSAGNNSSEIDITSDKLFLFSQEEVLGTINDSAGHKNSFPGEGSQYEYFKNAPTLDKSRGSLRNVLWWLRSPNYGNRFFFCMIQGDGIPVSTGASYKSGVSFGFCV